MTKKYPSSNKPSSSTRPASQNKPTAKPGAPKQRASRRKEPQKRSIPWFNVAIIGVIVVVLGVLVVYRATGTRTLPGETSVDRVYQKYTNEGALILDVREQFEWDEYHIPDAVHIPLGELASRTDELPKDRDILVVCRSGNRSLEGRDILREAGFSRVTSMSGGMIDWRAKNYPITVGN